MLFKELELYAGPLRLGLERVLGRERGSEALGYFGQMERQGSYISDPEVGRRLGAFFVGNEEDLGFYVMVSHARRFSLDVSMSGRVSPAGETLQARPVFLYWPLAIAKMAQRMKGYPLPPYFTPWLHEFGHFLCYWMQPWPLMAAIGVLAGALAKRGIVLSHMEDLDRVSPHTMAEDARQMVRMLLQMSSLNEAMAIWWEEQLLIAMEFQAGDLLEPKKRHNPFVTQLEGGTREDALDYIANWAMTRRHEDLFSRNFVASLSELPVDKWSFLNGA